MKFSKSKDHDDNYLASIIIVKNLRKHSNADALQCVSIFGNNCIVTGEIKEGDKMIYFPVESAVSAKLLSELNLFNKPYLNKDQTSKKYFEEKGRVRAVKLRGEPSQGFLLEDYRFAAYLGCDVKDLPVGVDFDEVNGESVCKKYVVQRNNGGQESQGNFEKQKKVDKKDSITQRLAPNQFRLHGSTSHLGRNLHLLNPDSIISITEKLHGCNAVFSKVLARRLLSKREKVVKFIGELIGVKFASKEYEFVYSSRSVIKNRRDGKYTEDVWGIHAEKFEHLIPNGFTVYGELVGFTLSGKGIQKNYPYGQTANTSEFYVFRVTYTDSSGQTIELDFQTMKRFCDQYEMEVIPVHYYGKADGLFKRPLGEAVMDDDTWRDWFLSKLEETFLDKPCAICNTGIVNEGIVLTLEDSLARSRFKFKSPKFLQKETEDRDKGETNLEEES